MTTASDLSKMSNVPCPAPGCSTSWSSSITSDVLLRLIDLHEKTAHPSAHGSTPGHTSVTVTAEKVKRPLVSAAGTNEEWTYFLQRWSDYKAATHLHGPDIVYQLLECCDDTLRKDITRTFGSLSSSDESTVLDSIKTLAVRQENIMVARVQLQQMHQDRDEPVRAFAARLRGHASVCGFQVECKCKSSVDYSNIMVRDALVRGLEDEEIRLDILGNPKQDLTLEEVLKYADAKESGKRSAGQLNSATSSTAATSSYHKQNKQTLSHGHEFRAPSNTNSACGHCGKHGHGRSLKERMHKCPAYQHTCTKCGILHHLESMCRQSRRKSQPSHNPISQDDATAIFDSLCNIDANDHSTLALDHHIYNEFNNAWEKRNSDPQPFIQVFVQALPSDANDLGLPSKFSSPTPVASYRAMADTGCQSCLAGTKLLERLKLTEKDLITVNMNMTAANNCKINIRGALVLRIRGRSPTGTKLETRQIVYFTDSTDRFFLSKQACIALGLISNHFPTIGETASDEIRASSTVALPEPERSCNCPDRQLPPPKPTSLPIPATEDNADALKAWLLDYYKSSTFNVCQHQPLPMMSGPPMRLMIDPNAQPIAHHTPIPVPIHWSDEVKADLDQDIRLGVIEPVPVGTPVTWCHRMVVCAKKSGKPRRTVDLQNLNRHAVRETHHTPSPFHQARAVPSHTFKSVFDAWNGYHSIAIAEEDRYLTTFITPWGPISVLCRPSRLHCVR